MEKQLLSDLKSLPTPCYVVDEGLLIKNLEILQDVATQADCKILLAQKAFSMFATYPLIKKYLAGTTASGLHEAKLGKEYMGGETHVFSTAYPSSDIDEIFQICDHITFNSFNQWEKYKEKAIASGKSCGIRVNPQHSTQNLGMYDPCGVASRLGVTWEHFWKYAEKYKLEGIQGIHFHTLCQQNSDALLETLTVVEEKFSAHFPQMKWINFGGGHHITKENYDREALIKGIKKFKDKYKLEVYLEPGEAIAVDTGFLVSTVEDIVENYSTIAILDSSAACHMPDVLEMPYRPPVYASGEQGEKAHNYRFAGPTCLAGDVIGNYSFDTPLNIGDKVVFGDMAIYSMVKNNTFNGMKLPSIYLRREEGELKLVREFGYEDFKTRLS